MKRTAAIGAALLVILGGLVAGGVMLSHSKPATPKPTPAVVKTAPTIQELWQDTNKERQKAHLPNLVLDEQLNTSAQAKCKANVAQNSFDHDLPNGTKWQSFITEQYFAAGENLAYDPQNSFTAQQTTANWIASPHHRENILNADYTNVGYAICPARKFLTYGSGNLIVQHFTDMQP